MADSQLFGVKELNVKLSKIERAAGVKVLRTALRKSTRPVVLEMKARLLPHQSNDAHRTYRKRLVAPGFSRRSIRTVGGIRYLSKGTISIALGVKAEAWYAIRFLDQGPHTITSKRYRRKTASRTNIKPYTLPKRPWFESTFIARRNLMLQLFSSELRIAIEKASRG